jgi:hypothetical protein
MSDLSFGGIAADRDLAGKSLEQKALAALTEVLQQPQPELASLHVP